MVVECRECGWSSNSASDLAWMRFRDHAAETGHRKVSKTDDRGRPLPIFIEDTWAR